MFHHHGAVHVDAHQQERQRNRVDTHAASGAGANSAVAALATLFSTGAAAMDTEPDGAGARDPLFDDDRIRVEYVTHDTEEDGDPIIADAFEIRTSDQRTERGVRRPTQVDLYDGPVEETVVGLNTST